MNQIEQDFQPYIDKYGLMSPDGKPSGNGLMFTAEMLQIFEDHGLNFSPNNKWAIIECLNTSQLVYVMRNRGNEFGQIGPDDLYGLALLSSLSHMISMRVEIILIKSRPLYILNNINPGKFTGSSWFGRSPVLIAALWIGVGRGNWWRRLIVKAGIWWASKGGEEKDNWRISYFLVRLIDEPDSYSTKKWWKGLHEYYSSMRTVYGRYWKNEQHPMAKHSKY